jgi:serine/threonine-protein kinase PknK
MGASTSTPQLPGYRDLTPLGRGGYSEVYRAYQDQFDRWVAVKVLTFALVDDRAQRRFLRDCRVAGRLSAHPNIVTVYDAGLSPDGRPYISMELFDRGSISDRLRGGGPFELTDVLRIAVSLAGALETAHRAGVVHRDVKPANVLLASYGQPALTDFGLSILAEHEVSVGIDALMPYHAPPEVLERTTVTPTSDVYALASTTYAMLAGRAPHQRDDGQDSMASLLLRILQVDIPPAGRADVPQSLDAALRAALTRDAHARTPTALDFAQAIQQVQAELGVEVTHPVVMDAPEGTEVSSDGSLPGLLDPSPTITEPSDSPAPDLMTDAEPAEAGHQAPGPWVPPPPAYPATSVVDGDETVHRSVVRPMQPAPPPPAPRSRFRRGALALGLVAVVAAAAGGSYLAMRPDDGDEETGPEPTTTTTVTATSTTEADGPTTTLDLEVPIGLKVTENPAGVQLEWDGENAADYAVLVLSEAESPRVLPPQVGASQLVPATALRRDVGYCFAVALLSSLNRAPEGHTAEAFSSPECIRGASEDTVLTD